MMAVNPSDGSVVWEKSSGSTYFGPIVYNGSIIFGDNNGWMYSWS